MPELIISILSSRQKLVKKLAKLSKKSSFELGYSGENPDELIAFLDQQKHRQHLLLMKPGFRTMDPCNPKELQKKASVYVVYMGNALPADFIPLLLNNGISGYINPYSLGLQQFQKMYANISEFGFLSNQFIPERYWNEQPIHQFPRPRPDLSEGEDEVLRLLCHNYTAHEISIELNRSEAAIRSRISNLKKKLRAESIYEIIVITLANSWVFMDRKNVSSKSPYLKDRKAK